MYSPYNIYWFAGEPWYMITGVDCMLEMSSYCHSAPVSVNHCPCIICSCIEIPNFLGFIPSPSLKDRSRWCKGSGQRWRERSGSVANKQLEESTNFDGCQWDRGRNCASTSSFSKRNYLRIRFINMYGVMPVKRKGTLVNTFHFRYWSKNIKSLVKSYFTLYANV